MGHGEDPPPREQTECPPNRDSGEGEDVPLFCVFQCLCVQSVLVYTFRCIVTPCVLPFR